MIHYITTNGIGNAWVGNELRIVQRAGVPFVLHGMRGPQQKFFESDWANNLRRDTRTMYPIPTLGMALSILLAPFLFGGRFFAAFFNALFGQRESFRCRIACLSHFFVACHWARLHRRDDLSHIHIQWAHSSGSIGMYGAWLLGKSFSFTGHAADLFRDRVALVDKVRRADFIACISTFHRDFYKQLGARDEQLVIVYCGIDNSHFSPPPPRTKAPGEPYHIRSSGRLIEKKGFEYLIDACKTLADRGVNFDLQIAGKGPLLDPLRQRIASHNLQDRISITGQDILQEDIPSFMHGGDVYCLPCVWASDNDVDGLPQMLMEAMSCGLPAVSTRLVGIPDLVIHEKTGLLVEPRQAQPIADALQRLMNDPALADRLAKAGRRYCIDTFDIDVCLDPLLDEFRKRLGMTRPTAPQVKPTTAATPSHTLANTAAAVQTVAITAGVTE